jgi:hypothetical protein
VRGEAGFGTVMGNGYRVLVLGVSLLLCHLDLHREKRFIFGIDHQIDAVVYPIKWLVGIALNHGLVRCGAFRLPLVRFVLKLLDVDEEACCEAQLFKVRAVAQELNRVRGGFVGLLYSEVPSEDGRATARGSGPRHRSAPMQSGSGRRR